MRRLFIFTLLFLFTLGSCVFPDGKKEKNLEGLSETHRDSNVKMVLQVAVEDFVRRMAVNSEDETLNKALKLAREKQSKGEFVTAFGEEYLKLAGPDAKLAAIFANPKYNIGIDANSTNKDVLNSLNTQVTVVVNEAFKTIKLRLADYGVELQISLDPSTGWIILELSGVDPNEIHVLLQMTGKLEFWETFTIKEMLPQLERANKWLADHHDSLNLPKADTVSASALEDLVKGAGTAQEEIKDSIAKDTMTRVYTTFEGFPTVDQEGPLFEKLLPPLSEHGGYMYSPNDATMGFARLADKKIIDQYLAIEQVRAFFPRNIKFLWGSKANASGSYPLYAIKTNPNADRAPLDGDEVKNAEIDINNYGDWSEVGVGVLLNEQGAKKFQQLTAKNAPRSSGGFGKCLAIVVDDRVYMAPQVRTEITGGKLQITGDFTVAEAKMLARVIRVGKLAVPVKIIKEDISKTE